jgi:hypothetical protein
VGRAKHIEHPERVDRLVLLDTYLGAEPEATRLKYFGLLDAASAAGTFPDPLLDIVVPIFFHAGGRRCLKCVNGSAPTCRRAARRPSAKAWTRWGG